MKILLTHRYFWPDTVPYALMLRSIAQGLSENNHEVNVYASRPSYRAIGTAQKTEKLGNVSIKRAWVFAEKNTNPLTRILNVLLYCLGQFLHILHTKPDIVSASTFPPVFAGWTGSLAAKIIGAKFIYHMQDVHPEVSKYSNGFLGRGIQFKLLRWLDNQTLRRASAIIVLSEDMANTLRNRGIKNLPIHIINNFLLDSFDTLEDPPTNLLKPSNKKRVIFAGNLGKFQNLPVLAEGIATCFVKHPDLELFFLGDGAAAADLKERWADNPQVKFGPFLPFNQASTLIREADVGLVSLTPDIYRVSYPSKVLTYLGLGVPLLTLVEPQSALAKEVVDHKLGVVPKTAEPVAIGEALDQLLKASNLRPSVTKWYERNATSEVAIKRWTNVIQNLSPSVKDHKNDL